MHKSSNVHDGMHCRLSFILFVLLQAHTLIAQEGQIVVLSPNGTETGTASWVSTVTYPVTWSSSGTVSSFLVIDLYDASGSNFIANLASNVLNTGVTNVVICNTPGDYRIRIWDAQNPTIQDFSAGYFSLTNNFHLTAPDGGEYWQIGSTQQVKWDAPSVGVSAVVDLWFTYDGDNWNSNTSAWTRIASGITNVMPGHNVYNWTISSNDLRFLSEKARMTVVPNGIGNPLLGWPRGALRDFSDHNFTNAGIVVTFPTDGTVVESGNSVPVTWAVAGGDSNAVISLFRDGVWSIIGTNSCVPGTGNVFNAVLTGRATNVLVKVESSGLTGVSEPFLLTDIHIIAPVAGSETVRSHWQIGATNVIKWISSGVNSNVTVKYTTAEMGGTWTTITNKFPNNDNGVITNTLSWIIPGPPSGTATVRVESATQSNLFAEVGPFSLSGIQITEPVGNTLWWDIQATNTVGWLSRDGASLVNIEISFDGGSTFEPVIAPAYSQDGSNYITLAPGAIRRPTDQARFMLCENQRTNSSIVFSDISAVNFGLRGVAMAYPSNNAVVNLGSTVTNGLQWFSALTLENLAYFCYMPDGPSGESSPILREGGLTYIFPNTDSGSCSNAANWVVDRSFKPSSNAVVKVVAWNYSAVSAPFTMRGVRITSPAAGENVAIGSTKTVTWDYAGMSGAAAASNYVSLNGVAGSFGKYGFTINSELDFGSVNWTVDTDADPTTNAVIHMQVYWPTQEADVAIYSQPFTLSGIKFVNPTAGGKWTLGSTMSLSFLSAGMGTGAKAAVYYSPDGTLVDYANPIANDFTIVDGVNTFTWNIANPPAQNGMPSANAHLMIVSGAHTNMSPQFEIMEKPYLNIKDTSIQADSSLFVMKWDTVADQFYNVYSTTNLLSPFWNTNLYRIPGNGGELSFTSSTDFVNMFFRLGVEVQ